jgi:SAM-dependent methyltransferase
MDRNLVDDIRMAECERVLDIIGSKKPPGCRILEIGAGTGLQAKRLSEAGFRVDAIDLKSSSYRSSRVWPVTDYDGRDIPFADKSFDVIFSSSVLEHIPHLDAMLHEMRRVLKDDGIAVHIVPATSWALLSALTHYPYLCKLAVRLLVRKFTAGRTSIISATESAQQGRINRFTPMEFFRRVIMPPRHGERGVWLSELYYFSKPVWSRCFRNAGWSVTGYEKNGLFYSGNLIFGYLLDVKTRKFLGRKLFGVCHIFTLAK